MKLIDGDKMLAKLEQRLEKLADWTERDIGGGTMAHVQCYREAKYWKGCIERGEFDVDHTSGMAGADVSNGLWKGSKAHRFWKWATNRKRADKAVSHK